MMAPTDLSCILLNSAFYLYVTTIVREVCIAHIYIMLLMIPGILYLPSVLPFIMIPGILYLLFVYHVAHYY
jgi:hypothetical protein